MGSLKALILLLLFWTLPIKAEDFPLNHSNPYVDLYLQRMHESKAQLKRAEAVLELEQVKFDIAKNLFPKGAMSREEYKEREANFRIAEAFIAEKKASIGAAESLYKLAITRTEVGQDMPICN